MSSFKKAAILCCTLALTACGGSSEPKPNPGSGNNTAPTVDIKVGSSDINALDTVNINVSATDADGDALSYAWSQTSPQSPVLNISQVDDSGNLQISIPNTAEGRSFTLKLTVSDGIDTTTDNITFSVKELPPFSFTIDSETIEIGENKTGVFELEYTNPRGDVTLQVDLLGTNFEGFHHTVNSDAEAGTVTINVSELTISKILKLAISATDSEGTKNVKDATLRVLNTSALLDFAQLKAMQDNIDSLINAGEETRLLNTISNLAYITGKITGFEKDDALSQISKVLNVDVANIIKAQLEGTKSDSFEVDETTVRMLLSNLDANFKSYIEPINGIISDALSSISNNIIPAIQLGEYYFDLDNGKYSQLWKNPSLGTTDDIWSFNNNLQFLNDIVFPENQQCNEE